MDSNSICLLGYLSLSLSLSVMRTCFKAVWYSGEYSASLASALYKLHVTESNKLFTSSYSFFLDKELPHPTPPPTLVGSGALVAVQENSPLYLV